MDADLIQRLPDTFGAAHYKKVNSAWQKRIMSPIVTTSHNGRHMVMGQRKWKVYGGSSHICLGGTSILEVAAPFIEALPIL